MAWPLRLLAVAAVGVGARCRRHAWFGEYLAHAGAARGRAARVRPGPDGDELSGGGRWHRAGVERVRQRPAPAAPPVGWLQPLYELSLNKFYLDEIYYAVLVAPLRWLSQAAVWFDDNVIDRDGRSRRRRAAWISAVPR